jgi:hypothetical protein
VALAVAEAVETVRILMLQMQLRVLLIQEVVVVVLAI